MKLYKVAATNLPVDYPKMNFHIRLSRRTRQFPRYSQSGRHVCISIREEPVFKLTLELYRSD